MNINPLLFSQLIVMDSITYLQHTPFFDFTKEFIDSRYPSVNQGAPIRILEVGCGTGEFAHLLKEHYQTKIDLTALDPSEKAIQVAQTKTTSVVFRPVGLLDDKNDELYDIIICTKSLHHCGDLQKTVERVYALLKKNGVMLAEELQPDRLDEPSITWLFDRVDLLTAAKQLNATGLVPPHSTLADPAIPAEQRWAAFLRRRSCHPPSAVKETVRSVFGKDRTRIQENIPFMHYYLPKFRLADSDVGRSVLADFIAQEQRALANNTIVSLGFSIVAFKDGDHLD